MKTPASAHRSTPRPGWRSKRGPNPSVAHSASLDPRAGYSSDEIWDRAPRYVDLDWLMDGPPGRSNTLYLTAPATEFARLAPVLGGLLGDLREQIHAWDIAGRRLSKPLLIVIDEAGQLELQWLPEEVSTIAGLGGMFVTGWQSRAQINHRYGGLADAVLGGHRSKIIFNGTDDPSTLDYVSRVAGDRARRPTRMVRRHHRWPQDRLRTPPTRGPACRPT